MRRAIVALAGALGLLVLALVANALRFTPRQVAVEPAPRAALDPGLPGRLAAALRFRTVSYQDPARLDAGEFLGLHRHLADTFPRAHRALAREVVGDLSLLFTWMGHEAGLAPVLLLAHLDVVPVDPATEGEWTESPYAGAVTGGFVWGRGAMDDKLGVMGLLEAVELLVGEGFTPRRTVYLAFGHDEEVGGGHGAVALAKLLAERRVAPEFALDEGLTVTEGIVPGVGRPLALIGIAEKGYQSLELAVPTEGGHSSRPPRETGIGILAAALHRLETHQAPAAIAGAVEKLVAFAGPETDFLHRLALANLWLFRPLVLGRLEDMPDTNALVRTTTAPTMLEGSIKENVLPVRPRAVVNFRIRPGETIASVTEHVRRTIDDPASRSPRSRRR
jgi:carboxypeptidase PM20D1